MQRRYTPRVGAHLLRGSDPKSPLLEADCVPLLRNLRFLFVFGPLERVGEPNDGASGVIAAR